jgi:hypothetical protein
MNKWNNVRRYTLSFLEQDSNKNEVFSTNNLLASFFGNGLFYCLCQASFDPFDSVCDL